MIDIQLIANGVVTDASVKFTGTPEAIIKDGEVYVLANAALIPPLYRLTTSAKVRDKTDEERKADALAFMNKVKDRKAVVLADEVTARAALIAFGLDPDAK